MKKVQLLIALFFISSVLRSQVSIGTYLDSDYFQQRVKTLDDFMLRFNYEQDPSGETLIYNDSLKNERVSLIKGLFDKDFINFAIYIDSINNNDSAKNEIIRFVTKVAIDTPYCLLNYYSEKWYAEVNCEILYKGKLDSIFLFLKTEVNENMESKWVIDSCVASFLDVVPADTNIKIGPVNHNLNFMELSKMSRNYPEYASNFASKDFKQDPVSIFFFLVKNKYLEIKFVKNIIYHFYQIPGYYFKVENIKRTDMNSGWLITDLKRLE